MSRGLSKSKLMSFSQCPRKLWLEVFQPELAETDPATEALFALGHEVGDIARRIFDDGTGILIGYEDGLTAALESTVATLNQRSTAPIFEATLERDGLLVRADILLRNDEGTRLIEVKASTKLKPEYLEDCAIQSWVFDDSPARPQRVALAHIDNQFVYQGDGDYTGLLIEQDVTEDIAPRIASVPETLAAARNTLAGTEPDVAIGTRCWKPYDCPFQKHCWKTTDFPISGLSGRGKRLDDLLAQGHYDVLGLPEELLKNESERRVWRVVRLGQAELLPGAREQLSALPYPRYYLDFETTGAAVPRWAGTRPYQTIPFQWSLHVESRDGSLQHIHHLDLTGQMPARPLAEELLKACGQSGPIFTYTNFEQRCIQHLADFCPDLRDELKALDTRLVDLHPIVKKHYYHPAMHGSWSIKAVLPTIAPELDYTRLGEIQEGQAAQRAYLEAISIETPDTRRQEIQKSLIEYCERDTLAMVTLARFLAGVLGQD